VQENNTPGADLVEIFTSAASANIATILNGIETITIRSAVTAFRNNVTGDDGVQQINGNGAGNDLLGLGGADILVGNGGDDFLDGGTGRDRFGGGTGDDTFIVDDAGEVIVETAGQGTDKVRVQANYALATDVSVEVMEAFDLAGTGALNITGNNLVNAITGNDGVNILNGGLNADTLTGRLGNDSYIVDNAADVIVETAGQGFSDTVLATANYTLAAGVSIEALRALTLTGVTTMRLFGNELAQTITGDDGANILAGFAGNDTLVGRAGADRLAGGIDFDSLTGGTGADTFVFNTALGASNVDVIADFVAADDTIELENAFFVGIATGPLVATAFVANATGLATTAAHRIVYETDTGFLSYDSNGSAAGGQTRFATLTGAPAITAADFNVV